MKTQAPKGTKDLMPSQVHKFQYVEQMALKVALLYGFTEIRTPTFEHTELFVRSVGDTTDVVQKEMYTFEDKGGRSITLRPEGTAGVMRSLLETGLINEAMPQRLSYVIPCYRYEKPQSGRLREFHQFGVELMGAPQPSADAETMALVDTLFKKLGVTDIHLEINSIGCPKCRPDYQKKLIAYFESHKDKLCKTCLDRLSKNPLRILDCKEEACSKIAVDAPVMLNHLCEECDTHYKTVKELLTELSIEYKENTRIVRGLDYYTKTVFEFISDKIGSQGTVCGGGRYDGLVETLGGKPTAGIGFGLGIERLVSVMENCAASFPTPPVCDLYIATMDKDSTLYAAKIVNSMRLSEMYGQTDIVGRSVKAQMKYADKINAKYTMVLGSSEMEEGKAKLKNMQNGETEEILLDDAFVANFKGKL